MQVDDRLFAYIDSFPFAVVAYVGGEGYPLSVATTFKTDAANRSIEIDRASVAGVGLQAGTEVNLIVSHIRPRPGMPRRSDQRSPLRSRATSRRWSRRFGRRKRLSAVMTASTGRRSKPNSASGAASVPVRITGCSRLPSGSSSSPWVSSWG